MSDRARLDPELSLTGHRRGIGGHQPPPKGERSFKLQSSTFPRRARARQRGGGRESTSTKPQARVLSLGAWSFPGAWSLRFEAFLFPSKGERRFKLQSSTFGESRSTKPQARVLSLEAWTFPDAWSLRFEAFLFPPKGERSFKLQSSTFRESTSTRPQARVLSLEAWSFPGAWSLRFEAFLFPCCLESEIFAHLTLHSFHPLRLLRANASSGN